jgi:hypothetical protein
MCDNQSIETQKMKNDVNIVWYREAQNELRWRREAELKLLSVNLTFYGLIMAAISFSQNSLSKEDCNLVLGSIVLAFLSILGFSIWKICHENSVYKNMGEAVVKWYKEVNFETKILPSDYQTYGQGHGYIKTIVILGVACMMCLLIAAIKLRFLNVA